MTSAKIKKIIYSILKELTEGDQIPTYKDYGITDKEFMEIINLMKCEGYLNQKLVSIFIDGSVYIAKRLDTVTMKGLNFLEENSSWNKLYKGIKEIRSFLPL